MTTASGENSVLKTASVDILEAGRFRMAIYALILTTIAVTLSVFLPLGWVSATGCVALAFGIPLVCIVIQRDELGAKFMLACIILGFVELLFDWYIIAVHKSLTYIPGGPFVWASPLYMPFAWAGVVYLFGAIGRWMDERRGLCVATIVNGVVGGLVVPYWETIAKYAGWWYYHDTPMLAATPYYIAFGEIVIFASLPLTFRVLKRANYLACLGTGIVFGLWIFVAYWLGIQIFG